MSVEDLAGVSESGQRVARGQEGKPERYKDFSAGRGARTAGTARPITPTGMLKPRAGRWSPSTPGPTPAVSGQPGARTATPRPLRQHFAQGHPAAADLSGPERLEILPPRQSARRPFGGAGWARLGGLGIESRPGERLRRDFADICFCLLLCFTFFAVCVTCCHLPFLPLNSAPVNFVFLSTLSLSNPSLSIWTLSLFVSIFLLCLLTLCFPFSP